MIPCNPESGHVRGEYVTLAIDSARLPDYIGFMADNINSVFEHELKRLEKRVDALVRVCDQLQDENKSLKQRQDVLTAERAAVPTVLNVAEQLDADLVGIQTPGRARQCARVVLAVID